MFQKAIASNIPEYLDGRWEKPIYDEKIDYDVIGYGPGGYISTDKSSYYVKGYETVGRMVYGKDIIESQKQLFKIIKEAVLQENYNFKNFIESMLENELINENMYSTLFCMLKEYKTLNKQKIKQKVK